MLLGFFIQQSQDGGPLETRPKELVSYLKQDVNTVVFSTYQSIELVSKAIRLIRNWEFDLIICDEAHRTFGSAAKNTFTIVHDNKKVPAKKRIYMTATPKVASDDSYQPDKYRVQETLQLGTPR